MITQRTTILLEVAFSNFYVKNVLQPTIKNLEQNLCGSLTLFILLIALRWSYVISLDFFNIIDSFKTYTTNSNSFDFLIQLT